MDAHEPDRIALVFGLVFSTIGAVTLVGLTGAADIDGGAALGASMVLAALLVAVVTVTSVRDRRLAHEGGAAPAPTTPADLDGVHQADVVAGEEE